MPEITDAEYRQFVRYQGAGTPEEVEKAVRKVPELESDNKKYRDRLKEVEAAQPGEGAVVLTGDDAKRWDAVKALGKTPEEITAELEKAATLETQLAARDRKDLIAFGLKAENWPDKVLPAVARLLEGATLEKRTVTTKDAKGAENEGEFLFVTRPGEGQTPLRLADLHEKDPEFGALNVEAKPAERQSRPWLEQKQGEPAKGTEGDAQKAAASTVAYTL